MSTMINDRTYRIARENTQAMIVDVQERLTPHIYDHENIVKKNRYLDRAASAQYSNHAQTIKKGLGDTLPELRDVLEGDNAKSFEKVTFSACDNNDSWHHLAQQNRSTVLLFGAEAHVCIMQTALDLLDNGMQPVIIGDAVGSRFPYDKKQAIRRIRRAGGVISTVESILFELCRSSEDPAFKTIINLIK
ncbi:LOW QUALITY PROTEIN: isochorismatase [Psychrobacter sp. JCM 18900]|nr:LOW QUALITY PROTEIN: isochorismatase [Psychrobacter sp. JCM 18900]